MLDSRQLRQALQSRPVARQTVGDDPLGRFACVAEQCAEKALGRIRVVVILQEDVQYLAVLVHRSPQVLLLASDPHEHLIQVPTPPRATLPTA